MARKKNLDEINSAAEKKTGNSVKRRSTNTVQNPTSTTKKDIQEIKSTVNKSTGLSAYQKKKASRTKTYQLLQDGTIPSRKLGTDYRIPKFSVIKYLYPDFNENQ